MKQNRKILISAAALLLVACAFFAIWYLTRPAPAEGAKTLTVTVVHRDGTEAVKVLNTDAEYLAGALTESGLVEGEQTAYGLFITTCDGETADPAAEEWWYLTKGGEMLMTGADNEPIEGGGKYELTLTVGYE